MMEAAVIGLGLWTPGYPNPTRWVEGVSEPSALHPPCELLGSRARRGTSLATRMAVEVASQAAAHAGKEIATTLNVFGSALGEVQTAIDQMAMIRSDGLLSPTRFKNSVHNTAPGLLSIAAENRGFCTALAAGRATVAMAFLEGMALLRAHGGPVIVALSDEPIPEPFREGREYDALALAFCLETARTEPRLAVILGPERGTCERRDVPEHLAANPVAPALSLLEVIMGRLHCSVPLELESEDVYCVEVCPT